MMTKRRLAAFAFSILLLVSVTLNIKLYFENQHYQSVISDFENVQKLEFAYTNKLNELLKVNLAIADKAIDGYNMTVNGNILGAEEALSQLEAMNKKHTTLIAEALKLKAARENWIKYKMQYLHSSKP